jgi:hypothetical protein
MSEALQPDYRAARLARVAAPLAGIVMLSSCAMGAPNSASDIQTPTVTVTREVPVTHVEMAPAAPAAPAQPTATVTIVAPPTNAEQQLALSGETVSQETQELDQARNYLLSPGRYVEYNQLFSRLGPLLLEGLCAGRFGTSVTYNQSGDIIDPHSGYEGFATLATPALTGTTYAAVAGYYKNGGIDQASIYQIATSGGTGQNVTLILKGPEFFQGTVNKDEETEGSFGGFATTPAATADLSQPSTNQHPTTARGIAQTDGDVLLNASVQANVMSKHGQIVGW